MKKGQISYEYLLVIGMLLVLILPFFMKFFDGTAEKINELRVIETVNLLSQAAESISGLNEGSKINVYINSNAIENNIGNDGSGKSVISLTTPTGKEIDVPAPLNTNSADGILEGKYAGNVNVENTKYGIALYTANNEPVINCIGAEEKEFKKIEECATTITQVATSKDLYVYGANFDGTCTKAKMYKIGEYFVLGVGGEGSIKDSTKIDLPSREINWEALGNELTPSVVGVTINEIKINQNYGKANYLLFLDNSECGDKSGSSRVWTVEITSSGGGRDR